MDNDGYLKNRLLRAMWKMECDTCRTCKWDEFCGHKLDVDLLVRWVFPVITERGLWHDFIDAIDMPDEVLDSVGSSLYPEGCVRPPWPEFLFKTGVVGMLCAGPKVLALAAIKALEGQCTE